MLNTKGAHPKKLPVEPREDVEPPQGPWAGYKGLCKLAAGHRSTRASSFQEKGLNSSPHPLSHWVEPWSYENTHESQAGSLGEQWE